MIDHFRPISDPARALYDAFQDEATKRRDNLNWIENERQVVYQTMCREAPKFGLPVPTMEDVQRAENYACGHVDYGSKWAYRLIEILKDKR